MAFQNVLVVDDEESMRHLLTVILTDRGYDVRAVSNGDDALRELSTRDYDLVLSDVRMPRMDGLALLRKALQLHPDLTFIVMSAYGTHDTAIEAMKAGAYDYVSKPFKPDEVLLVLRKAEERLRLSRENRRLRSELAKGFRLENFVGASPTLQEVLRQLRKVAPTRATVLVTGESGTGKELVARAIHELSPRSAMPFVAVNCGAIPAELIESELFGHVRGAFTDASRDKKGLAAEADGGTLFLDEIGELPLHLQVKLLRFLEDEDGAPRGGHPVGEGGRARGGGDGARPGARHPGRPLPGGPLLPAQRGEPAPPVPPGAIRRRAGARRPLPGQAPAPSAGGPSPGRVPRGARRPALPPVARKRPRAGARHRAGRGPRRRSDHRGVGPAGRRAGGSWSSRSGAAEPGPISR